MRFLGAGGKMGFGGGQKGENEYYLMWGWRGPNPAIGMTESIFPFFQTGFLRADTDTLEFDYFMKCNYDSSAGFLFADREEGAHCLLEYDEKLLVGTRNFLGTDTNNKGLLLYDQDQNTFQKFQNADFNSTIFDVVKSPTGTTGNIFVTGQFTTIDGNSYSRIAKWDGSSWNGLGSGLNNIGKRIAIDSSEKIYVSGLFSQAGGVTVNYIAQWDGSTWSGVGGSTGVASDSVNRMFCDSSDNLWIVGSFTSVQGITANRIAKWDGSNWSTFGSGANAEIHDIFYDKENEEVYIIGPFTTIDGVSVDRIAKWDGLTWSDIGGVNFNNVSSIGPSAIHKGSTGLYIIYIPTNQGDLVCAKYNENTSSWDIFPVNPERPSAIPRPRCILEHKQKIYFGGERFGGQVGGIPIPRNSSGGMSHLCYFNKKNGELNVTRHPDMYSYVFGGASRIWWDEQGGRLYTYGGASYIQDGSAIAYELSYWDNSTQSWVGVFNSNSSAIDILRVGDYIYLTGAFALGYARIVRYDPSTDTLSSLSTGLNGSGRALASDGTDLYVGGAFTTAGGVTVNRLAKWNGSTWSTWGGSTGANDDVWSASYATGDTYSLIYVGGEFTSLQGVASTRGIASYDLDSGTWSSVGGGLGNGYLIDTAWDSQNKKLYVYGSFTSIGGQTLTNLAVWDADGLTWSSVGNWESIRSNAFSIATNYNSGAMKLHYDKYTSKLWVLGQFCLQDTSSDKIFNNVAIWDGVEWTPFTRYQNEDGHAGSGVGDYVSSVFQIQNDWGLTFPTS